MASPEEKVLAALPYEELKKYCFTNECSWNVWREKARQELSIPYEFFDNSNTFPKPLYGIERYLTLRSYFKLSPLSTVRVYNNGTIEGVYESLAGAFEAVKRDSLEGLDVFLPRLKPYDKRYLTGSLYGEQLTLTEKTALDMLGVDSSEVIVEPLNLLQRIIRGDDNAFLDAFAKQRTSSFYRAVISSGDIGMINTIISLILPGSESLERPPKRKYKLNLGYLNAALFSCNPVVLKFFMKAYGHSPTDLHSLARGYNIHRNVLGSYECLRMLDLDKVINIWAIWDTGNLDLIYAIAEMKDLNDVLESNLGNIPLILTLPSSKKISLPPFHLQKLYPLTTKLLTLAEE